MEILKTLLAVYIILLLTNGSIAFLLWFKTRNKLYVLLMGAWGFTLVNFFSQAATMASELGSILSFSTYIVVAYCWANILREVVNDFFSFRFFYRIWASAVVITIALYYLVPNISFTWLALPIAISVAIPQIYTAYRAITGKRTPGGPDSLAIAYSITLLINGLHFLDYPFLRPNAEFAIFGYSFVIATSMIFGILLPCIINSFIEYNLTSQLKREIKSRIETEEQLEKAVEEAKRSARVKSNFLANMSHEIRTPINGVVGLNDLLLQTKLTDHQTHFVNQIKTSSTTLLAIVNNILDLAQLESSTVPIYSAIFSPKQFFEDIVSHYAITSNVQMTYFVKLADDLPDLIITDEQKLKQICFNIINNTLKHSEAKTITLSAQYSAKDTNQGIFTIDIKDDGIGIPKKKIGAYGRRYEQADYSKTGGAGLGFSIIKELVSALKGSFSIESDIGKGVEVRVIVPVTIEITEHESKDKTVLCFNPNYPTKMQGKILIVEDNLVNIMVLEGMLDNIGVEYDTAVNGEKAMELYSGKNKNDYSLILMDVQLPDANGLQLTKQIRDDEDNIPIIIVSAFAYDYDVDKAFSAGATGYMKKPYTLQDVEKTLNQYYFYETGKSTG